MQCPQGVSLGIPPVAASASSSRLAGKSSTSLFPIELSGEAGSVPKLLVFRVELVLLDQFFGFHPWGWSVIRGRPRRAQACAYGCYCLLKIFVGPLRHASPYAAPRSC